ncbi:Uncharacterised protein [Burkholderia pseudomallei]|nr:Uncharacterised protein [Burkholderia pseudomallei]CAJ6710787.1 Uncharacterised protein [Burkholderia pseudomallei]
MSVFETAQRELRQMFDDVVKTTQWDAAIAHGKVKLEDVPESALEEHRERIRQIVATKEKYGI